jgi:hypothetical protein
MTTPPGIDPDKIIRATLTVTPPVLRGRLDAP